MADYTRLQNSFATGYLDPLLYGLYSSDAYSTGLKECLNYIPSSRGYLYRRPGTRFLDYDLPTSAKTNRLHAIKTDNGPLLVLISEGRIDFFSTDLKRSITLTNDTPYSKEGDDTYLYCDIPWSAEDIADLSIYEFEGDLYIVHPDYPPYKITVVARGSFYFTATSVAVPTYECPADPNVKYLYIEDAYIANAFYSKKIEFKKGGIETFSKAGHYPSCQTFKGGRWYVSGCSDSPASIYASKAPNVYGDYRFDDFGVGNYYLIHIAVTMKKITVYETTEYDGAVASVRYESDTTTDEKVKIDGLDTEVPANTSTTVFKRYSSSTASTETLIGTWTGADEASSDNKANTKMLIVETTSETWALKSDLQNDDAIELTETDMYGSRVNWLITQQRVIAGTNRSIWMDDGSAATPSTFDLVKTLGVTTSKLTPIIYSSMIIFVPADRRSVKAFNYDTDAEGYVLSDLSVTARSLFRESMIQDITLVEGNETIVWVLLENGKLLSCTLGATYGWAEHSLGGDGKVVSMSAYHTDNNEGRLYLTVQRGDKVTIEALIMEDIVNSNVYTLCDCMIPLDAEAEVQDMSSLSSDVSQPYNTGSEVCIVAGGWAREPFAFDPTAQLVIGPGSEAGIYIGHPYLSRCQMLWQELPVASGQTSLGFFRKAISMTLQVYRSAGAECGWISGTKKHLDPFQRLAKTNTAEPSYADYYTGIVKLSVPSNTNEQVNAVIECSYPLPMTIQAIETRYKLQEV